MEKSLIKLLLSHDFYLANRDRIVPTMFPGDLRTVFDTIVGAHKEFAHSLTVAEVKALHKTAHPVLTRASRDNLEHLLDGIEMMPPISDDVGTRVLESLWKVETFRELADIALTGMEGKVPDLESMRKIIERRSESFLPLDDVDFITTDLDELLEINDRKHGWGFNISSVAEKVDSISGGEFMMLFGRPNSGKTSSWVSLSCAPGGWASQGAKVLAICNEEPARRTLLRCVSAANQQPEPWIKANKKEARKVWEKIASNVILADSVGMTMARLDNLVRKIQPSILVVDQLDKVSVSGSYSATHERLRAVYVDTREIAKKYNIAVVAISQASAEADGKAVVLPTMAEGSRTGKFAELDLAIGIGQYPQQMGEDEDFTRIWTIGKNKLTGFHGQIYTVLDPKISTFRA